MSERLSDFQAKHKQWKEAVTYPVEFTPRMELDRAQQEYDELTGAITLYEKETTPENAREVAMEAVDVMIGMLGIVSSVDMDAAVLMAEKIKLMQEKYDPAENQEIRRTTGLRTQEALAVQKDLYQRRQQAGATRPRHK